MALAVHGQAMDWGCEHRLGQPRQVARVPLRDPATALSKLSLVAELVRLGWRGVGHGLPPIVGGDSERKFEIAQRAYRDALEFGIPAHEIFYDPLALPISTGIEEDRRNGAATVEAIRRILDRRDWDDRPLQGDYARFRDDHGIARLEALLGGLLQRA